MKFVKYMNEHPWAKILLFILWSAILIVSATMARGLYSWGVFLLWIALTVFIGLLANKCDSGSNKEMRNLKINALFENRINRFLFLFLALAFPFIASDELSNLSLWVYPVWGILAWVASGLFNENGFRGNRGGA